MKIPLILKLVFVIISFYLGCAVGISPQRRNSFRSSLSTSRNDIRYRSKIIRFNNEDSEPLLPVPTFPTRLATPVVPPIYAKTEAPSPTVVAKPKSPSKSAALVKPKPSSTTSPPTPTTNNVKVSPTFSTTTAKPATAEPTTKKSTAKLPPSTTTATVTVEPVFEGHVYAPFRKMKAYNGTQGRSASNT